ncbi:MAG: CARDB domain-containing protein, partial [Anaerolineae bacterium]
SLLLGTATMSKQRVLTATLIVGGLSGTEQVTFDYGIQLADLIPGLPWVEPGGVVTRTVGAWVVNHGDSAATATTARFYDGDPDGGGVLIDTAVVPGLAAGAQAMVSVSWDIQGQGGDHNLFVQVDPVTEFDVGNNVAGTAVSLPTFAANLTINPTSLTTGELLTVNSQVMNLQGAVSLPVTVTVEILAPTGTAVHAQTWAIVLNGGEVRQLAAVWNSPPAASGGVYQAIMTIRDENDYLTERHKLIVVNPRAGYDVYLPIIFSN